MAEKFKQKAKDFIDRINKETDGMWLNKYYLSDLLVMFATEETKELEKENAELQDKLKNLASVAEVRLANWQKYEKENRKLTKAKEIINKLIKLVDFLNEDNVKEPIIGEAEQFLEENPEKKNERA